MDAFRKSVRSKIGPGGLKCPCCNYYRNFGTHPKKLRGLNKIARKRLKQELDTELTETDK